MMPDLASVALVVSLLGGGGLVTWWQASKPSRLRAEAVADAILGEPEVRDRAGNVIRDGQPGLVHRVSTVEEAVKMLAATQAGHSALEKRVERNESRLDGHDQTLAFLIGEKFEKGAEAALRATESVIDVEPDQ